MYLVVCNPIDQKRYCSEGIKSPSSHVHQKSASDFCNDGAARAKSFLVQDALNGKCSYLTSMSSKVSSFPKNFIWRKTCDNVMFFRAGINNNLIQLTIL